MAAALCPPACVSGNLRDSQLKPFCFFASYSTIHVGAAPYCMSRFLEHVPLTIMGCSCSQDLDITGTNCYPMMS